ncbi:MAG: type 1 glutamine amidotransferase, partial [Acinetobacter junii]|nr:type 1 glutamine amidotransferase [Acinetobacter junii]
NQLYQIGRNVLGFQFHPEMTPHALQLLIENEEDMAVFNGEFVQSIAELKKTNQNKFQQGNVLLNQAIEYVVSA